MTEVPQEKVVTLLRFIQNAIKLNDLRLIDDLAYAIKTIQSGKVYKVEVMEEVIQE